MTNKPLLRTTMELVEVSAEHDNLYYARRVVGTPASETYCFATFTVLNVHPDAEIVWKAANEDGEQFGEKVLLADGTERWICPYAEELLEIDDVAHRLFYAWNTEAALRAEVDALLSK